MKVKIYKYIIIILFVLFFQYIIILNVEAIIKDASTGTTTSKANINRDWDKNYAKYVGLKVSLVSSTGSDKGTYVFLNESGAPKGTAFSITSPKKDGSGNLIRVPSTSKSRFKVDPTTEPAGIDKATYEGYYYTYYKVQFDTNLTKAITSGDKELSKKIKLIIEEELPNSWINGSNYINMHYELTKNDNSLLNTLLERTNNVSHGDYILIEPMVKIKNYYGTAFELMNNTTDMLPPDYLIDCTGHYFCKEYTSYLFAGSPAEPYVTASGLLFNTLTVKDKANNKYFATAKSNNAGKYYNNLMYSYARIITTMDDWKIVHRADAPAKYDAAWNSDVLIGNQCLRSKSCPKGIGLFRYINECESDFIDIAGKENDSMAKRVELYMKWGKRGLLDLNNTSDAAKACSSEPIMPTTGAGCFKSEVKLDAFSSSNLSNYNDIYVSSTGNIIGFCKTTFNVSGDSILNFSSTTGVDFSAKAGQLLFVGKEKDKSIAAGGKIDKECYLFSKNGKTYSKYNTSNEVKDSVSSTIKYVAEDKTYDTANHYLSFGLSESSIPKKLHHDLENDDVSGNDYIGLDITYNVVKQNSDYKDSESYRSDSEKPIRRLLLIKRSDNLYTSSVNFYLNFPMVIVDKSTGKIVDYFKEFVDSSKSIKMLDSSEPSQYDFVGRKSEINNLEIDSLRPVYENIYRYNFIGYGIPSKFNVKDFGNVYFSVKLNTFIFTEKDKKSIDIGMISSKEIESKGTCKYEIKEEIVDCPSGDCELNLEFRIINTKNPFPGKSGNGRLVGSNWCQEDDCSNTNDTVEEVIIDANNSYNKKKTSAKYTINLTPSDILDIRKYNKTNAYDDYTIKEIMDGDDYFITSEFLEKSYIGIELKKEI